MLEEHGFIAPEDLNVFTVVDEPKHAAKIIVDFKEAKGRSGLDLPSGMKRM